MNQASLDFDTYPPCHGLLRASPAGAIPAPGCTPSGCARPLYPAVTLSHMGGAGPEGRPLSRLTAHPLAQRPAPQACPFQPPPQFCTPFIPFPLKWTFRS